jgi:competence ComEA-like helix-hairpin-helix protein
MNFRQIIHDYFTFSRNERKGIIILLVIIFFLAIANKLIYYFETPATIDKEFLDSKRNELGLLNDSITKKEAKRTLFSFDPNQIDSLGLDRLDLPINVKRNLLRYRQKGGKFYSGSDFKKIYGVSEEIFIKIEPFLLFQKNSEINYSEKGRGEQKSEPLELSEPISYTKSDRSNLSNVTLKKIDLNSADSIQLKELPGIGEKLSKRIVKYREILGGFHSVDQLNEVYGMEKSTVLRLENRVMVDTTKIRKLDVNFSNQYELSRHPYIQANLAKKIIRFRTKYGSIQDVSNLLDSMILNIHEYSRLKPYL